MGDADGLTEGALVGDALGGNDGFSVGEEVGVRVGDAVGNNDGWISFIEIPLADK